MMASILFPRAVSPRRCAHGRSGATQVSRWRTAPAPSFGGQLYLSSIASRRMGQGRFCSLAGLASFLSSVGFLFWLTLACGPP